MARAVAYVGVAVLWGAVLASGQAIQGEASSTGIAQASPPDTNVVERIRAAVVTSVSEELESSVPPESVELYRELAERNRALLQRRRELEYEDPIASGLKKKLVAAEKDVLALRRSLQARLDAIDEIKAVEAERRKVMQELQKLRSKSPTAPPGGEG